MIAAAAGLPIEVVIDESRMRPPASEVERLIADASLAKARLRWTPHISVEEGLACTVAFIRDNLHLYRPDEYAL